MLTGMDIPVTAGPWLGLGVVLGILLAGLAGRGALGVRALRSRRFGPEVQPPGASSPPRSGPPRFGEDDLPGFLESPPGSTRTPPAPSRGWAALAAPLPPPPPAVERDRSGTTAVMAAMAGTALLLIGAAAAVAAVPAAEGPADSARATGSRDRPTTEAPRPDDVSARLTFGGVVLERHAAGVTVAYPEVQVTTGARATAEIELLSFNCLLAEAPDDPMAAGCIRWVPEHAELSAPELAVESDAAGMRVSGRFATVRRPNGSAPVPTGRVYELTVSAAPTDDRAGRGPEPATGFLQIGDDRVGTSDEGPNDITYGG